MEISFPPAEVEHRWCQFWLKDGDDVRRERKAKVRHGRFRAVPGGTGVNGLSTYVPISTDFVLKYRSMNARFDLAEKQDFYKEMRRWFNGNEEMHKRAEI